ncbi:S-adenosyl-l-methionine hydroxide adenosyltransferase family protein [Halosimplex aquaticum]|uniref:S-adenosyl-l-methionine hydroxide adenosyltransferase family protein n=1 Tax=Halosimplex aquaticum TaxID=3026162 RepID=A0ABD5XTD2_9EURY|nr:SAM-dependent chlorinase/fluorinase [Halosimplex aquaticum]
MITLASDFPSPYPAAMRGVICSRTDARIEDVAHDFPRQDVRAAAFWLREVLPYFPPATHCVVVDPGVGTDRAAIVVEAGDHQIVAPDNGVAVPVARELAGESDFAVWDVDYSDDETASNTFHGRDVFAPAAADVHDADSIGEIDRCTRTDECVDLRFPDPEVGESSARGEVLVVDGFGNVVTNVPGDVVADRETVRVGGESVPVRNAYAALDVGDRLVTVGSHGNVEFAVNQGRGDDAFGLGVGDDVLIEW